MAKEPEEDLWRTESGLIDDFDFTIRKAYFGTDAMYNEGRTLLMIWEGETDDPDNPTQRIMMPCGSGWETRDGGKTAVHESGKKFFVGSSIYGRVINRCIDKDGLNIGDILRKRGKSPTIASVWEGLKFHMKREKLSFGEGLEARERLMPVQFLGEVDQSTAQPQPTTGTTAQPGEADLKRNILKGRLTILAKQATDYNDFVTKAMAIEGVSDDPQILALVVDEKFYSQVHG